MSEENVEAIAIMPRYQEYVALIRGIWGAWNTGDFAGALKGCAPDIEMDDWHSLLGTPDAPEERWYHGHEGAGRWTAEILELVPRPSIFLDEFVPLDEDRLLISARFSGRTKIGGAVVDVPCAALVTVRGDKVRRMALFQSHDEALEAAGLSE
jgi:hypothetical protein